jgi:hypothetical protein
MELHAFLNGATAMACLAVAVFFLRFWRATQDRLFMWFSFSFAILGANRVALSFVAPEAENRPYLYLLRLFAFAIIAIAVIDKNRKV